MTTRSPFDFIKAIDKNEDLYAETQDGYNAFLTNRNYSLFPDTLLYANEINRYGKYVSNDMNFYYYFYSLPKKKRFAPWPKQKSEHEMVLLISEYYNLSYEKSRIAYNILQKDEQSLNKIKNLLDKGGIKKK